MTCEHLELHEAEIISFIFCGILAYSQKYIVALTISNPIAIRP